MKASLIEAGRNASLTVSSNAGKVVMNLRADLSVLGQQDQHPHHPSRRRNGPSSQRRRDRRAAARQAAAVQAEAILSLEEKYVLKKAEKAESECIAGKSVVEAEIELAGKVSDNPAVELREITEQVAHNEAVGKDDTVIDEFGSNASFVEGKSAPTPSQPPPSRPSRGLRSVDYYAMRFEDYCDDPG